MGVRWGLNISSDMPELWLPPMRFKIISNKGFHVTEFYVILILVLPLIVLELKPNIMDVFSPKATTGDPNVYNVAI